MILILPSMALDVQLPNIILLLQHGDVLFPKDDKDEVIYADDDYVDTWKAMEECVDKGQVRSIGLSNFNIQQTERVLSIARIQPSNMQVSVDCCMDQVVKSKIDIDKKNKKCLGRRRGSSQHAFHS